MVYFNEFDPLAASWIRELQDANLVGDGMVDERSIADVKAADLAEYRRCHFFAGIAGWELALGLAGWPADRPVWTGSCPCQPFSAAGKQKGEADERHLWPEFRRLIAECRPPTIFGEQVASKLGREWLAGVRADLEALGYAVGAADLCAAGVGSPHIRQRLFWVADANCGRLGQRNELRRCSAQSKQQPPLRHNASGCAPTRGMADANGGITGDGGLQPGGQHGQQPQDGGAAGGLVYSQHGRPADEEQRPESGRASLTGGLGVTNSDGRFAGESATTSTRHRSAAVAASSVGGHWDDYRIIHCRDGKARRVPAQSALFPLAHGISAGLVREWKKGVLESAKEVMRYVQAYQTDHTETLRMVWDRHGAEEVREWLAGVCGELQPAAFLFDYLLDVAAACDGAAIGGGVPQAGAQTGQGGVRGVRGRRGVQRASCGRQPNEQHLREPSDALRTLSRVLARCAQSCWEKALGENAATLPLRHWNVNRVGLLRGAGNAIVPQLAAAFIRAFLEAEGK